MRCPRCGGYLTQHVHYEEGLECGTTRDWYARCWGCGEWYWRPRLKIIITVSSISKGLAPRGIIRVGCSVKGCTETRGLKNNSNPYGMCPKHWGHYSMWLTRNCSSPAPVIQIESGEWIENIRRQRRGFGRATRKGTCSKCGKTDISIAARHPFPICGVCRNISRGLTAGGR